jgi:glycerophosphoryl diester phosphodiesterase
MTVKKSLAALVILVLVWTGIRLIPPRTRERHWDQPTEISHFDRWTRDRQPLISAHRGGPMAGFPENCIATFENSLDLGPCVIECDVRMSSDSVLILMHDETLDRTTAASGRVDQKTWNELSEIRLKGPHGALTHYMIPSLNNVLDWARDRTVLTLDVKRGIPFDRVIQAIRVQQAERYSIFITYTTDAAKKVYALNSEVLISVTVRNMDEWQRMLRSRVPAQNMIAFVGLSRPEPDLLRVLHDQDVWVILGTMGNLDRQAQRRGLSVYQNLYEQGADILSTDYVSEVSRAIFE